MFMNNLTFNSNIYYHVTLDILYFNILHHKLNFAHLHCFKVEAK